MVCFVLNLGTAKRWHNVGISMGLLFAYANAELLLVCMKQCVCVTAALSVSRGEDHGSGLIALSHSTLCLESSLLSVSAFLDLDT